MDAARGPIRAHPGRVHGGRFCAAGVADSPSSGVTAVFWKRTKCLSFFLISYKMIHIFMILIRYNYMSEEKR